MRMLKHFILHKIEEETINTHNLFVVLLVCFSLCNAACVMILHYPE
jgi:hypothetical protein